MIAPYSGARPWLLPTVLLLVNCAIASDPRNNFCRRYAHQTTVIDDKLYIDGGWVNYNDFPKRQQDYASKWRSWQGDAKSVRL